MADENPASSADPNDEADKKETIRITLPPKTETPVAKRETVRINIPESTGDAPKKETSKVSLPSGSGIAAPPPMSRPSAPPAPPPLSKPMSGMTPPPKPPPLSSKPTIPLRPAPSGAVPPAAPGGSGIVAKPASPKKETARISLPGDAPKSSAPALPKATVKMQQTQPLMKTQPPPSSGVQQTQSSASGIRKAPASSSVAPVISTVPAKSDTLGLILSILALAAAGAAAFFAYMVLEAAKLPSWVQ
jgi:hypothetical protein